MARERNSMDRERNSLEGERNSLDCEQVEVMEMKKNLQTDQLDSRFSVKGVMDIVVERNSLGKENEEVVMMKTKNNLELRTRQETNPTKFDKVLNFWEDMGGRVGRTGMLLQPGESSGIGDRKRKREPSMIASKSIPEGSSSTEMLYLISKQCNSSSVLSKEDWTESNRGIQTNRLSDFGTDRGEQGELETRRKFRRKQL